MEINMDHCKFENTAIALNQCLAGMGESDLSTREHDAKKELYALCSDYIEMMEMENDDY